MTLRITAIILLMRALLSLTAGRPITLLRDDTVSLIADIIPAGAALSNRRRLLSGFDHAGWTRPAGTCRARRGVADSKRLRVAVTGPAF